MNAQVRAEAGWSLFRDWCAAAELPSLPAEPATIVRFLEEFPGGRSTRLDRIRTIRQHHAQAELPDPFPATAPDLATDPVLGGVLSNLIVNGWPGGLAGCRDGFLLAMFGGLRLTRRQLRTLRCADVGVAAGKVAVHGRRLERTELPGPCPVCAVTRWLRLLNTAEVDSWYEVKMSLAGHRPQRAADQQVHDCLTPIGAAWRRSSLLLPAIDRYGSVQIGGPIARRSITEIVRKRADSAANAADLQGVPFPHRPSFEDDPNRPAWTRAQSNAELAELDPVWEHLNAGADEVAARLEALLAEYDR